MVFRTRSTISESIATMLSLHIGFSLVSTFPTRLSLPHLHARIYPQTYFKLFLPFFNSKRGISQTFSGGDTGEEGPLPELPASIAHIEHCLRFSFERHRFWQSH